MLSDIEASYENITNSIRELQDLTSPQDVVIVYYGGHTDGDDWIAADIKLNDEGDRCNVISSEEVYSLIDAIPALRKHLIMDAVVGREFEGFINCVDRTKICTLSLCASPGQFSFDVFIPETEKSHGYFTYILVQELWQASEEILQQHFFDKVIKSVQSKFPNQKVTPFFLGEPDKPLFFAQSVNQCPELFAFSERRFYSSFDDDSLLVLHHKVSKQFTIVFPDFDYSLGLAFLQKGNDAQALTSFKTATKYAKQNREEKNFALGIAQFNNQRYNDAYQTFQRFSESATSVVSNDLLRNLSSAIERLAKARRYALLIGINTYSNAEITASKEDAVSDTITLQRLLVGSYGFQAEDITVLIDQDATCQNILAAFRELVDLSRTNSTLFYFAGRGSADSQDNPTILASDSRHQNIQDIKLAELAQIANQTEMNLVSIIDSNWTVGGRRFIGYDKADFLAGIQTEEIISDPDSVNRDTSRIPKIGNVSIYPESIKSREGTRKDVGEGVITSFLIRFLKAEDLLTATYQKLQQFDKVISRDGQLYLAGNINPLDLPIFNHNLLESKVRASLTKIEQEPIHRTVLILQRLIEQRNGAAPEELFNLGIAYYRLDEYGKSISALQTAIDQVSGQNNTTTERQETSQRFYPEAHYWLGRVLCESKRDPARAVSELRLATQQNPDNIAAHYYLGKALRSLVEQEILTEAERAFQTYLNAGAPLGQQEEVQEFFKSRKETEKN